MSSAKQRGAALLMAMIIVALVSTLAGSMVWQQWRSVQVEIAERARSQSTWILTGALDWAGLILKEDARPSSSGADHLGEPWAVPLEEARLSTFLAADKSNTDDAPDAFLSGRIIDAQSRFNLRNLMGGGGGSSGGAAQAASPELASLRRLCANVDVTPSIADLIAKGLQDASAPPGTTAAPLMPKRVSQLAWLGVDPEALRRLEPYLVLLPVRTTVNINTAPREVLAAVIPGLDLGSAERLVQSRQRSPFKKRDDIQAQLTGIAAQDLDQVDVNSSFFEIRGRLRLEDHALEQRSLVQRLSSPRRVVVLSTERVNMREGANP